MKNSIGKTSEFSKTSLPQNHRFIHDVDICTGHYAKTWLDLQYAVKGLTVDILRTYSSLNTARLPNEMDGLTPFGPGWHHSYISWLIQREDNILQLVGGEGEGKLFDKAIGNDDTWRERYGYTYIKKEGQVFKYVPETGSSRYYARKLTAKCWLLSKIADPWGNQVTLKFDAEIKGLITQISDSGKNVVLSFNYFRNRHFPKANWNNSVIKSVTASFRGDAADETLEYKYDDWGNLTSVVRGARKTAYEYTQRPPSRPHRLSGIQNCDGHWTRFLYEDQAYGNQQPGCYDRVCRITDGQDQVTQFRYQLRSRQPKSALVPSIRESRVTQPDPDRTTVYHINPIGLMWRVDYPLGKSITFDWDNDARRLKSQTDPRKVTHQYAYDRYGFIEQETLDYSAVKPQGKDHPVPLPKVIRHTFKREFDKIVSVLREEDDGEKRREAVYAYRRNKVSAETHGSESVFFKFDNQGMPVEKTTNGGQHTTFANYTALGQARRITRKVSDSRSIVTKREFDGRGLPKRKDVYCGSKLLEWSSYDFDRFGQLKVETTFSGRGQPKVTKIDYYPSGLVKKRRIYENDRLLWFKCWTYDPLGRVAQEVETLDGSERAAIVNEYTWNGQDQVTAHLEYDRYTNGGKTTRKREILREFKYDLLGRLEREALIELHGERRVIKSQKHYTYWGATENVRTTKDLRGKVTQFQYDAMSRLTAKRLPTGAWEYFEHDARGDLRGQVDQNGHRTEYSFLFGRKVFQKGPSGCMTRFRYNNDGLLKEQVETHSKLKEGEYFKKVIYEHDLIGRVTKETTHYSHENNKKKFVRRLEYRDAHGVVRIHEPTGFVTEETRDRRGLVYERTVEHDGKKSTWTYTFNAMGFKTSEKSPRGGIWRYYVTSQGLNHQVVDPYEKKTTFFYDGAGNVLQKNDRRGFVFLWRFDVLNRMLESYVSNKNGGEFRLLNTWEYNDQLGQVTETDHSIATAKRAKTVSWIDALGRTVVISNGQKKAPKLTLRYVGQDLIEVNHPSGQKTTRAYDCLHRLTEERVTGSNGETTRSIEYDDSKLKRVETQPNGAKISTVSDGLGREVRSFTNDGHIYQRVYDAHGSMTWEKLGDRAWKQHTYNAFGKLQAVSFAGKKYAKKSLIYDSDGNLQAEQLERGRQTELLVKREFDLCGRMKASCDAMEHRTALTYDAEGNIKTKTLPNGLVYEFERDAWGNPIEVRRRRSQSIQHFAVDRDVRGRIISVENRGGANAGRIEFSYDESGGISTRVHSSKSGKKRTWKYKRDAAGNIERLVFPNGESINAEYDAQDRPEVRWATDRNGSVVGETYYFNRWEQHKVLERIATTPGGEQRKHTSWFDDFGQMLAEQNHRNQTTHYTYDKSGRLTALQLPDGTQRQYDYNDLDQVVLLQSEIGDFHFDYDKWNRLERIRFPRGMQSEFQRFPNGWIREIRHGRPNLWVLEYECDRNAAGDVTKEVRRFESNEFTKRFEYDPFGRLARELRPGLDLRYDYDDWGRRLSRKVNGDKESYIYDDFFLLAKIESTKHGLLQKFKYDANGRMKTKIVGDSKFTFEYGAWQYLQAVSRQGRGLNGTLQFAYDLNGKITELASPSAVSQFVLADDKQVLEVIAAGGKRNRRNKKTVKLIYAGHLVGGLTNDGESRPWIALKDKIQSNIFTQHLQSEDRSFRDYSAFGKELFEDVSDCEAVYFGGALHVFKNHEIMSGTDLLQLGDRLLDVSTGQFTTPDPMASMDVIDLLESPYSYARNRPTHLIDPTGWYPFELDHGDAAGGFDPYSDWLRENEIIGPDHELELGLEDLSPRRDPLSLEDPDPVRTRFSTRPPLRRRVEELREEYGLEAELEWEGYEARERMRRRVRRMPRDTGLHLDVELENHQYPKQSIELKGRPDGETQTEKTPEGRNENATVNNVVRSLVTLSGSAIGVGVGFYILSAPITTPIVGFGAFMSVASGLAGTVLGGIQFLSSPVLSDEAGQQLFEGTLAGTTLTGSPGGLVGGSVGVLTGGDLDSLHDGAFYGNMTELGISVGQSVREARRINSSFRSNYAASRSHHYRNDGRLLKPAIREALGESSISRAGRRFNPTLGRTEYREFSHAVSQSTGRSLQRLRAQATSRIPSLDYVLPDVNKLINHPLNGNMRWGIEHALEDAHRFNFVPKAAKGYFAPMRKNGLELLRARTPEWSFPAIVGLGRTARMGATRGGRRLMQD